MSDQDFFFDEDEKPSKTTAKTPAKKSGTSSSSSTRSTAASTSAASAAAQPVSMTIAILMGVIGLLLGTVIGLMVGMNLVKPAAGAIDATGGAGTAVTAPQLSPEQMQSGELPPNHPAVGGGAATGTPAPK